MKRLQRSLTLAGIAALGFSIAHVETHGELDAEAQAPERADTEEAEWRDDPREESAAETPDITVHRFDTLRGSRVQNREGERLGRVDDLAIDLDSGGLAYVVVRKGMVGFVGDLVPVPPEAFEVRPTPGAIGGRIAGGTEVLLDIEPEDWESAPTVDRGRIAQLADERRGRSIYEFYGQEWEAREFGAPDRERAAATDAALLSAKELLDWRIHTRQDYPIGHVDDVLVTLEDGRAPFVAIQPDARMREADHDFAVPTQALRQVDRRKFEVQVDREQVEAAERIDERDLPGLALQLADADHEELREAPGVYRIRAPGVFGRPERHRNR